MHKIEISGVVHQNLSGIFNLCNAEGNHEIKHSQIDIKVPKFQLTLTLGRLGKEREEKVGKVPWSMGRAPERMSGRGGAPTARVEAIDGGGGGFQGRGVE
jgi:hypothetical protein